ncbi:hypothetical protein NQ314_005450 [Rhamnusium bicolor]|uniref:Uncharacterized protein n=1 Tax=Rhamnusium bicolor TaxID=1586634 RepID=A0AAV8ZI82_9CUCU|nr:hypothetical protein NQ314_005450 [Rhamnusium bicolor]
MKNNLVVALSFAIISKCYVFGKLEKIVDLTWSFDNDTVYWTGIKPFTYTKKVENDARGYWYVF